MNRMNLVGASAMNGDFVNATREHDLRVEPTELEWHQRVMKAIQEESLATAGYELSKLVNFGLKTQHSEQTARELRNCVLAFWNRCEREK